MTKVIFEMAPFASAARTATTTVTMPLNRRHSGAHLIVNVTAASGTGGLTLHVREKDPISGNKLDLLVDGTPITAIGTYLFIVAPSTAPASGSVRAAVSRHMPQAWEIQVVAGDSSSYTYSISATMLAE
jgi:hypothetical protein